MKNTLVIYSSVRTKESVSRALTDIIVNGLKVETNNITVRDLTDGIPFISEQFLEALNKSAKERSSEERQLVELSDELIKELESSDCIIIGLPMYNFGPPAILKAWADLVARAGVTFQYSEQGPQGLLSNKKAYIVAVTGGTPVNSVNDFMTPWMQHFLRFIGIKNITTIIADAIYTDDGDKKIQMAKELIHNTIAEMS